MARVCIFNEKGGVGKTTATVLTASWLAYSEGRRVCVVDFDHPSHHISAMRGRDSALLRDPRSPLSAWMASHPDTPAPFGVYSIPASPDGTYSPGEVFPYLEAILSAGFDYVFYDFPGRFARGEPASFVAAAGLVDFLAVPMDTDLQSRRGALVVADAFRRQDIPLVLFWNRVSASEARGDGSRFRRGAEPFLERGLPVMEESLRDIRKLSRDGSEPSFIRSTLCFPERHVRRWNPGIMTFLEALRGRIDSTCTQDSQKHTTT